MSTVTTASQTSLLTRNISWEAGKSIAKAAAIGAAVSLIVFVIAWSQGWLGGANGPIITIKDETISMSEAVFNFTWFGLPAGVAAIAAFVVAIVLGASFVRIPVSLGATRSALAAAHLATGVIISAVVTLFALAMALLDSIAGVPGNLGVIEMFSVGQGPGAVALATLRAFVLLLSTYAFGLAIGIVFIRFHWLVGTGALIFLLMILPMALEWAGIAWLDQMIDSPTPTILDAISLVLAAAAFAWMVKTLEVD